jgi:hypothetical protein
VINENLRIGIFQQVFQFLLDIAVLDVDSDATSLENRETGFNIFIAVIEVKPDLAVGFQSLRPAPSIRANCGLMAIAKNNQKKARLYL